MKPLRRDVALVVSDTPCVAAGAFTINKAKAAPVQDAEARLPSERIRAIVLNSGNANALTGSAGLDDVAAILAAAAAALGVPPESVLTASTGVIGMRLPVHKVCAALPAIAATLRDAPEPAAEAIMTMDSRPKLATRALTLGGVEVTLTAIAKGSGMVAPQLATVLAVVTTDAAITSAALHRALREAIGDSFNMLTVDNDMSTNDAVFALANGRAGNARIEGGDDCAAFTASLSDLCADLAKQIAADGEGATKLLSVRVSGAPDVGVARDLARSVAGSNLVKAAVFGADPNWGRVLATVGARAGSQAFAVDPFAATVRIQGVTVFAERGPRPYDAPSLRAKMRAPEVNVDVELAEGAARATAWGCDLTYDYVKINADYTSLIVAKPDGGLARDDRFANYSPAFKMNLLVEALSYISRFAGKRCVVKYGGAAMAKDTLKKSFCDDIQLLRSCGLLPVVVHGGGADLVPTLERFGAQGEVVDGVRITSASDLKVLEMVLTGRVNTELVTLLNQDGGRAVGVSGKDGALLRARKAAGNGGRDLGQHGEITAVNADFLEMLLEKGYIPVVSPVGIGDDGQSWLVDADFVAAEIAVAVGADKLLFLTDVAGILDQAGELLNQLDAGRLADMIARGAIVGGMRDKAQAILRALAGGVRRVHVVDGRTPHTTIAELFTDRGVGTLVTA